MIASAYKGDADQVAEACLKGEMVFSGSNMYILYGTDRLCEM